MIPAFSVFLNTYLMVELQPETWVRFTVWMLIGEITPADPSYHESYFRRPRRTLPERFSLTPTLGSDSFAGLVVYFSYSVRHSGERERPVTNTNGVDAESTEPSTTYKHAEGLTHL